jgi:hypothetical protein
MTDTIPDRTVTERGFTIYDQFADTYGRDVRVQESSSAEGSHVWIFATDMESPEKRTCPHLDIVQAERVRDALDAFIREHKEMLQAEGLAASDLDETR